jgi:hypothetical protein
MSGRDEQLGRERDAPESRQQMARETGETATTGRQTTPDERPPREQKAEADLLKSSGGDPLTQESD